MITCYLEYEVDANKLAAFEAYGRTWIALVNRLGGTHHGYLLPYEGPSDLAIASFSFPSLADYERYRIAAQIDAECQRAVAFARETGCIKRFTRHFLRPVLEGDASAIEKYASS